MGRGEEGEVTPRSEGRERERERRHSHAHRAGRGGATALEGGRWVAPSAYGERGKREGAAPPVCFGEEGEEGDGGGTGTRGGGERRGGGGQRGWGWREEEGAGAEG